MIENIFNIITADYYYSGRTPTYLWHKGIDFGVIRGTPVYATQNGVITNWTEGDEWKDYQSDGPGKSSALTTDDGRIVIYGHFSEHALPNGTRVTKGDLIAYSGNTGMSYGPHLHYEIRQNGSHIDPMPYLENADMPGTQMPKDNYDTGVQPPKTGGNLPYKAYSQFVGWLSPQNQGQTAGITGHSLRLEAFKIDPRQISGLQIDAKVWLQDKGWVTFNNIQHDTVIGTEGENRRIEAVQLSSNHAKAGRLQYSVHISGQGWSPWVEDGTIVGEGNSKQRIEAIRIRYINTTDNYDVGTQPPKVGENLPYRAHSQLVGWLSPQNQGQTAGITGHSLRLEAFKIDPRQISGLQIDAKVWLQDRGWVTFNNIQHDTIIGTVDEARRIEAVQLSSNHAKAGKLQYSVHISGQGWSSWVEDGAIVGEGNSKQRIEAIRIRYFTGK